MIAEPPDDGNAPKSDDAELTYKTASVAGAFRSGKVLARHACGSMTPQISVVVVVRYGECWLGEAIASIQDQTLGVRAHHCQ